MVLNPMEVTVPVRILSPDPSPPKLSQSVLTPTPDSLAIPLRPVSVANVGTRSTQKQVPIPLMHGFRLAMGTVYFSPST